MTNIEDVKKGTTTIGLVCKEGVVMATEMRATMGTLIAHKTTQKLFRIDDNLGLTVAGVVGDAQTLARYITAEVELYKLKRGQQMSVRSAATLTSNILAGSRFYPYWVGLILGGVDREGSHVYALDMGGGAIPDDHGRALPSNKRYNQHHSIQLSESMGIEKILDDAREAVKKTIPTHIEVTD